MEDWKGFNFTIDLIQAAVSQLDFLKDVDTEGILYTGDILKQALYRYERYWLPLCIAFESHGEKYTDFYPPLDVAWIWHCHMLSPTEYKKDCESICGQIIDHVYTSKDERIRKQTKTIKEWEKKGISYDYLDGNCIGNKQDFLSFTSCIKYDLIAAADRQKSFFYQVSLPHWSLNDYLSICLERYVKFLNLKQKSPATFIVPCYGIDLIWHSHQLNPKAYARDTQKILGYLFPHDDTVNDRTPGSKLCVSDQETRVLWNQIFRENFFFPGGMFRG